MLYRSENKEAMLDILKERMSGIADCIMSLLDNGYIPNRKKYTIFDLISILIDSYENIDLFSEEQQAKLDNIYNKVIKL